MHTGTAAQPARTAESRENWLESVRNHWPEYLSEATGLGLFMVSACVVATLLEHPSSLVHEALEEPFLRRVVGGVAMGLTLIALIHSPFGKRSGAHLNPVLTVNYYLLGKVRGVDALFYSLSQFVGGAAGVGISHLVIGPPLRHAAVNFAATVPGPGGAWVALAGEFTISFTLMYTVLTVSNSRSMTRLTPFFAAALVASFITFEAPLSGMSMNTARTAASASWAGDAPAFWVYLIAPLAGMTAASQLYVRQRGLRNVFCAKLHHHNSQRCIFRCNYDRLTSGGN